MSKYTNARYPEKINDLINNDGTINMPEEGPVDNEATAQEIKELIESLDYEELPEEAFDKVFRFDLATLECIESSFDTHPLEWFYQWVKDEKFYIVCDFTGNYWTSEDTFDTGSLRTGLVIQTDAETGMSKLMIGFDEEVFALSGTIRINFDPNRGI